MTFRFKAARKARAKMSKASGSVALRAFVSGVILALATVTPPATAQVSGDATVTLSPPAADTARSLRPKPRPPLPDAEAPLQTATPEPAPVVAPAATATEPPATAKPAKPPRDPSKGAVTNLPIPRYVSLKGSEGNARRGPSLTHRIDWVFTSPGMPLRVTAEHENWRRVEDAEGMGGWVHYALLSGVRSVLVTADMAEFRMQPDLRAKVLFEAERGVVGRLMECQPDWCRVNVQGEKGWAPKSSLWGVDPGEVVE